MSDGDFDYIRDRLDERVAWYTRASEAALRRSRRLQVLNLVAATAVSVTVALDLTDFRRIPNYTPAIFGTIAAVCSALLTRFDWQAAAIRRRVAAFSLQRERWLFLTQAGPFEGGPDPRLLVERCEEIIAAERALRPGARGDDARRSTAAEGEA
ncbi:MAG: DUF4231 domain-containing protein [Alphaproteobacteria bacterium]|nr:DUF4231 domain-containing protein [Alphaproteobacteria bacterium]